MAFLNFLLYTLLTTGICLELTSAAPAGTVSPPNVGIKPEVVHANENDAIDSQSPTATISGESSLSLGFKQAQPPASILTKMKRDVEQEADSANGKTPLYLFKKDFYHPNTRKFLTSPATSNFNEKGSRFYSQFSGAFPGGMRYHRNRRSFQADSFPLELQFHSPSSPHLVKQDGESQLDNHMDAETFFRIMALLGPNRESNNMLSNNEEDQIEDANYDGTYGGGDADYQDLYLPIDLGYYGGGEQADFPFMEGGGGGGHLSKFPETHGLYFSPQKQHEELDNGDAWLDNAVPLQSHFKTRRSDNTLFRFNPVKSHFRRYQKRSQSGPLDTNIVGGRFGQFYEPKLIRARRSFNPAKISRFTM